MLRSLLKISFAGRVDHSQSRTFCCFGFRSATIGANRGSELLLHALCARSFGIRIRLKTAQLNTNNQSTFSSPRSFTFFKGPICFSHPNGFSTNHRLLKLIAYPGCRLVRSSIATVLPACYVRVHTQLAYRVDEVARVIGFVRSRRDPTASLPGQLVQH